MSLISGEAAFCAKLTRELPKAEDVIASLFSVPDLCGRLAELGLGKLGVHVDSLGQLLGVDPARLANLPRQPVGPGTLVNWQRHLCLLADLASQSSGDPALAAAQRQLESGCLPLEALPTTNRARTMFQWTPSGSGKVTWSPRVETQNEDWSRLVGPAVHGFGWVAGTYVLTCPSDATVICDEYLYLYVNRALDPVPIASRRLLVLPGFTGTFDVYMEGRVAVLPNAATVRLEVVGEGSQTTGQHFSRWPQFGVS